VEKSGNISSELFYNIGNCYYRKGNYPYSVLYYEKALRLNPNDEDARTNLKIVNAKLKDKFEPLQDIFFVSWWKSFCQLCSRDVWAVISLIFFLLSAIGFALFFIGNTVAKRKTAFILSCFLVIFVAISLSASVHRLKIEKRNEVIVLQNKVAVMSAPSSGKEKFIVNAGTKLLVIDEIGDILRVKTISGDNGWLNRANVVEIK
jgi:tetratricopeptide (TPR) repeat protein